MKKIIYLLIFCLICSVGFGKKKSKRLSKKNKESKPIILVKDPYTLDDINKLAIAFTSGKKNSLQTLIAVAVDKNQILSVRMAALNALSDSKDPMLKTVLKDLISNSEFVELDIMSKTIKMLLSFDDLGSTKALTEALLNSENKIMNFRTELVNAIGENNTEDKIIALLDLYEISLSNHQRMNELLTLTLGEMDDQRSIPILMDIAKNDNIELHIRNRAIEILSRKDAPELVDFFIERLGSPGSNDQMLDFIHNSMGLVERDRMLMALLESYQTGKTRYYAVLHSMMNSLEDYSNPEIKPVFIEVAKTDGFPRLLRIKAIQSLASFNDPLVLDELIPLLESSTNYNFYYEIVSLSKELNAGESYNQKIKQAGLKAMQGTK